MLSHPRKTDFGPGKESLWYAIPAQDGKSFFSSSLSNPGYRSRIRQEVRHQLRGPFDVAIGSYDFEFIEEARGQSVVRAFRLRKIGHFANEPGEVRAREFEGVLNAFLPSHPGCVPY